MSDMVKGEAVIIRQEYDIFDNLMEGAKGIYIKTDEDTGKHLIYFPQIGEWGEVAKIERVSPGFVPAENEKFVSRVTPLKYTADEKQRAFSGFGRKKKKW